jgi:hypothetical protein
MDNASVFEIECLMRVSWRMSCSRQITSWGSPESGDQSETAAHLDAFISRRPFAERVVPVDASKGSPKVEK